MDTIQIASKSISQLNRRSGWSAEVLGADTGLHISTSDRGPDKHGGACRESDDAHSQAVCGQHTHAAQEWHHAASKACGGGHKGERLLWKVDSTICWSNERCCRRVMLHTRNVIMCRVIHSTGTYTGKDFVVILFLLWSWSSRFLPTSSDGPK